ncbi:MAG: gliding motility-associated ABC transporter permease subunit GldF [Flavobacteriales bacterium]|nr:gliding motility-associated ABC transporter permease subunit GldF [Flavobacteriales bacterium]MCB9448258.1 gliding motility-associated ABC transporter permease subunit GldF [Flavobacteriales bacterium]
MFVLLKKEIHSFLYSLIGYIVIIVFLVVNGLFLWLLPQDTNIFNAQFATLAPMFGIAPWVFLFLIPAITMRSFSDEKKIGTIELLMTRPLTDLQIILAKYLAGLLLVLFSLIPTLLYIVSVYVLADPPGNLDFGGLWGSYLGLLFLGSSFVAIGIFTSSITENQIVAFILSVFLCFFCYYGFESVSTMQWLGAADRVVQLLGIDAHYNSMSRGVIDTRDVLYFGGFSAIFVVLTKIVLESRKW